MSSLFKSEVAPKGLDFTANDMIRVTDKYMTILTVVSYPRTIGVGFLSDITSVSGVKMVIKHIPVPFSTLSKLLNKQLADLRTRYQEEKDAIRIMKLSNIYEIIENGFDSCELIADLIDDVLLKNS